MNHYLHQAVRFQTLKAICKKKSVISLDERLDSFSLRVIDDDTIQYKELKRVIQAVINELPEDQRMIFSLHTENGLTYKQIADQLGISTKTVEKKMSKTLKQLRYGIDGFLMIMFFGNM